MKANSSAVEISTSGYLQEIGCPQALHRRLNSMKLTTGTLSYHLITDPHSVHLERLSRGFPRGSLKIATLKKLPKMRPKPAATRK
jgi:hypothetical protein